MTTPSDLISAICAIMREKKPAALPATRLRAWLSNEDAEVRGAAYHLLRDAPMTLEPSLTREEFVELALDFVERTIGEREGGEWAFSGYETAWDLASWFGFIAQDESTPRPLLDSIVGRLGALYERLGENGRETLVNGALEHIFERKKLRNLFRTWQSHPVLARAYADSCLWGDRGGDSPLVGRRRSGPTKRKGDP